MAALDDLRDVLTAAGLDDVVLLVINHASHEGYAGAVDGYALPVLQDTAEARVFDLYDARGYDLVGIGREGTLELVLHDVFPDGDRTTILAQVMERMR